MPINDDDVIRWLRERQENCQRIARLKPGAERAGWYEDEAMLKHAADAIVYYREAYSRKVEEIAQLLKLAVIH